MIRTVITLLLAACAFAAHAASVDVNKASQAELESIQGIGPGMSTKILDERKKGAFKDWNDMVDRVKGVGTGNAAKLSTQGLTVNGAAYKAGTPATLAKGDEKKSATLAAPATKPAARK